MGFVRKGVYWLSKCLTSVFAVFSFSVLVATTVEGNSKSKYSKIPPVQINYVLFLNIGDKVVDEKKLISRCANGNLRIVSTPDQAASSAGVLISREMIARQTLPNMEALAYFGRGFSQSSISKLQDSDVAISFTGLGPFDKNHTLLNELTTCVSDIALNLGGFIHDAADGITFTPEAFSKLRVSEIIRGELSSSQFGTRAYRVGEGIRMVSMGLEKFGHTNIAIAAFAEHHMGYIDKLVTLALQHIVELSSPLSEGAQLLDIQKIKNPQVRNSLLNNVVPGGSGSSSLGFKNLEPLDGDPMRLLGMAFTAKPGKDLWEEQSNLLFRIFGTDRDISNVPPNFLLENAIRKARIDAVSLLNARNKWDLPGYRLRLAIELSESREIVWVEVKKWQSNSGTGILLSEPLYAKHLKSGSEFSFAEGGIVDYKLSSAEKLIVKGGVDELAQKMGSRKR